MHGCGMHVCITTVGMLVVTKHVFCIACAVVTFLHQLQQCLERNCVDVIEGGHRFDSH